MRRMQVAQVASDDLKGWWKGSLAMLMLSPALTLGMEALLDKHEYTNCIGLKAGTSKGDGVPPT